ncbi:cathepsin [Acrasis kona]|uniref:Cathepsin n=1 Tax=Acrasis kona TaxID=1008807 RepID=A0AAW2Z1M5_9EUKA
MNKLSTLIVLVCLFVTVLSKYRSRPKYNRYQTRYRNPYERYGHVLSRRTKHYDFSELVKDEQSPHILPERDMPAIRTNNKTESHIELFERMKRNVNKYQSAWKAVDNQFSAVACEELIKSIGSIRTSKDGAKPQTCRVTPVIIVPEKTFVFKNHTMTPFNLELEDESLISERKLTRNTVSPSLIIPSEWDWRKRSPSCASRVRAQGRCGVCW